MIRIAPFSKILFILPLLAVGFGCSTQGQSPAPSGGEGPRVNWDRPFGRAGLDLTPTQAADAGAIRQAGLLEFTPVVPKFSILPRLVQVMNPSLGMGRSVDFAFTFPRGPDFPTDGRVTVLEQCCLSPPDVVSLAQAHAKDSPGRVSLIWIGSNVPAELGHNNGVGVVLMSLSSDVMVQIAGPALQPSTAQKLAETFG